MATYLIETPHTPAECSRALDEIATFNPRLLTKSWFACDYGEHTGWATVDTKNDASAKEMLPTFLRSRAKVRKVGQYTAKQIKGLHKK